MENLENISLAQIAPPSIKYDKNVSAIIEALDPELRLIVNETQQLFILSRIDELDEKVLDLLAWQFHVDFYDLAKDLEGKREQVKSSIQWHMKKGTVWAILKAIDMVGADADFINWYEFGGEPYTFKIKAILRHDFYKYGDKEQIIQNILRAINDSKATRSFLAKLDAYIIDSDQTKIFAGMAQGLCGWELMKLAPPENKYESKIYIAFAENKNRDISMGVDLKIMNELLMQFEARIFDRLEQHEARIMSEFNTRQQELNLQLEEIKELLRWA